MGLLFLGCFESGGSEAKASLPESPSEPWIRLRFVVPLLILASLVVAKGLWSFSGSSDEKQSDEPDPCLTSISRQVQHEPSVNYSPGRLEQLWLEAPHQTRICNTALQQVDDAKLWLSYSKAVFSPKGQPAREPTAEEASVLSFFSPKLGAEGKRSYIEPLSGMARHPLASICSSASEQAFKVDLFDISYLIVENACGEGPKPRTKYYDLGCASNGDSADAFRNFDYHAGSGMGPSIPLFFQMYKDRCLEFDEIYGWEARTINISDWWRPVPDSLRHRIRFYNVPVDERACPASFRGALPDKGSFLRLLAESAKPEDFVVLKVDIDGGPELNIVEAIAERPELAQLVDELFFEYHFDFDGINFGWGFGPWHRKTVDTALDLMRRLREAGIRSHFWI